MKSGVFNQFYYAGQDYANRNDPDNLQQTGGNTGTSRYWWNKLYFNGNFDDDKYYMYYGPDDDSEILYYMDGYRYIKGTFYTNTFHQGVYGPIYSGGNHYVINYEPVASAITEYATAIGEAISENGIGSYLEGQLSDVISAMEYYMDDDLNPNSYFPEGTTDSEVHDAVVAYAATIETMLRLAPTTSTTIAQDNEGYSELIAEMDMYVDGEKIASEEFNNTHDGNQVFTTSSYNAFVKAYNDAVDFLAEVADLEEQTDGEYFHEYSEAASLAVALKEAAEALELEYDHHHTAEEDPGNGTLEIRVGYEYQEPSCTQPGQKAIYSCAVCGQSYILNDDYDETYDPYDDANFGTDYDPGTDGIPTQMQEYVRVTSSNASDAVIPALGHEYNSTETNADGSYKYITFNWNESTINDANLESEEDIVCFATFTCDDCGEESEQQICTVTVDEYKAASCETAGSYTLTASASIDSRDDQQITGTNTISDDLAATGHDWFNEQFIWSSDYKSCTFSAECLNDSDHNITNESCEVTSDEVEKSCTTDGHTLYTATYVANKDTEFETTFTDTKEVTLEGEEATGHTWDADTLDYMWDSDNNCLIMVQCSVCKEYAGTFLEFTEDEDVEYGTSGYVTAKTVDATCEEDGTITYKAVGQIIDPFTEEPITLTIDGEEVSTFTDSREETISAGDGTHTFGDDPEIAGKDATCTEDGQKDIYKCSVCENLYVENEDGTYTQVEGADDEAAAIPATGHTLGSDPVYTKAATCTEPGYEYYQCTCECCGTSCGCNTETVTDDTGNEISYCEAVEIAATGNHDYAAPVYVWDTDSDPVTCTATMKCNNCDNVITAGECTITSEVTTEPTCTQSGTITYTAKVDFALNDGDTYVQPLASMVTYTTTKEVELDPLGHDWPADSDSSYFTWSEDDGEVTCTVTVPCSRCDEKLTQENVEVTPNYDVDGNLVSYTASIAFYDASGNIVAGTYSDTYVVEAEEPEHEHEIGTEPVYPAVAVTCTADGHVAIYQCSDCGTYFILVDEDYVEITYETQNDAVIRALGHDYHVVYEVEPTCTDEGYYYYACQCTCCDPCDCNTSIVPGTDTAYAYCDEIAATGHDWTGEISYDWEANEESATCTVTLVCGNDATHVATVTLSTEDETIKSEKDNDGNIVYTIAASGSLTYEGETAGTYTTESYTVNVEPVEEPCTHEDTIAAVDEYAAVAATCTEDGHVAIYQCSDCGTYFILVDEDYVEITYETQNDAVIRALGHDYHVVYEVEPTCTDEGYYYYACQCTCCDSCDCNTSTVPETEIAYAYRDEIAATGHDWSETADFEWAEDGQRCTATIVCENDSTHFATAECTVTKDETESDETKTVYKAEVTLSYKGVEIDTFEDTYTVYVEIPEEPCTHEDLDTESPAYPAKAATCTADGNVAIYYCEDCGAYLIDDLDSVGEYIEVTEDNMDDAIIPAHGHTWKEFTVDSTCTTQGHYYYYCECSYCEDCDCNTEDPVTYIDENGDEQTQSYIWSVELPLLAHTAGEKEYDTEGDTYRAPTCTVDGSVDWVIKCTECETVLDQGTETIPALGHNYSLEKDQNGDYLYVTFEWCDDDTNNIEHLDDITCTATFTCSEDGCTATSAPVDCTVTYEEDTEATCTGTGDIEVTATAEIVNPRDGDTLTATATENFDEVALGHDYDYDNAEFNWVEESDGSWSCATATVECTRDTDEIKTHTTTEKCTVTENTTSATCTADGKTVYTATFTIDDTPYSDTKEVIIPATGHTYSYPTFTWSDDYSECTATITCTCGDTKTETCFVSSEVTKDATCTDKGEITYTATVDFAINDNDTIVQPTAALREFTATKTVETPALGHSLEHSAQVPATCTEPGTGEYWYCTVCGKYFSDEDATQEIEEPTTIPATGHNWGAPAFSWSDDNSECTATITCSACKAEVTVTCDVTENVTEKPDCTNEGKADYTATADFSTAEEITDNDTFTGLDENKQATDTKTDVEVPATGHSFVIDHTVAATCGSYGYTVYKCSVCDEELTGEFVAPLDHNYDYDNAEFTWVETDEGYACTATVTCLVGKESVDYECTVEYTVTTEPTTETKGLGTYTATYVVNDDVTLTDTKTVDIPELVEVHEHTYEEGNVEYLWDLQEMTCIAVIFCDEYDTCGGYTAVACTVVPVKTPATCTEAGYTTYTATAIFEETTYTTTYVVAGDPATGHDYDYENAKVVTEATCVSGAVYEAKCKNCDETTTYTDETVNPENHATDLVFVPAVEATETEEGSVAYWYCESCGKMYAADENGEDGEPGAEIEDPDDVIIPPTGDEPGDEPGKGGDTGDEPGEGGDTGDEPGEGGDTGDEPGEGGDTGDEPGEGGDTGDEPGEGGDTGDEPGEGGETGDEGNTPSDESKQDLEDKTSDAESLLDNEDLSDETKQDLQDAIDNAKDALENPDSTQEDIDKALEDLQDAIDKAQQEIEDTQSGSGEGETPEAPTTDDGTPSTSTDVTTAEDLTQAADDAQSALDAATEAGVDESLIKDLEDAIANAEAVLADENATQADIDAAMEALQAALDAVNDAMNAAGTSTSTSAATELVEVEVVDPETGEHYIVYLDPETGIYYADAEGTEVVDEESFILAEDYDEGEDEDLDEDEEDEDEEDEDEEDEEAEVKADISSTSPATGASLAALAIAMGTAAAGIVVVSRKKKEEE